MATQLAAMLAKFNSSQQKVAQHNVSQAEQQKKPQSKKPPVAKAAAAAKPKDEKPAVAQSTSGVAVKEEAKVKLKLKDQLKGSQNGFTPAAKPVAAAPSAAAPGSRVIGKRFKDVLDFLQANLGVAHTPAAIQDATGHDVRTDTELRRRLEASERVRVDAVMGGYRYKPQHDIEDRATLLNFIRDHPRGTFTDEVKDSYKGVLDDLAALQRDKRIYIINHPEHAQDALFPREMMDVHVDDDLSELFHSIEVPQDLLELQHQVEKAGMTSALGNQPHKRPAAARAPGDKKPKKPRQQRINIAKATNVHLPHLFQRAAPLNIDTA